MTIAPTGCCPYETEYTHGAPGVLYISISGVTNKGEAPFPCSDCDDYNDTFTLYLEPDSDCEWKVCSLLACDNCEVCDENIPCDFPGSPDRDTTFTLVVTRLSNGGANYSLNIDNELHTETAEVSATDWETMGYATPVTLERRDGTSSGANCLWTDVDFRIFGPDSDTP